MAKKEIFEFTTHDTFAAFSLPGTENHTLFIEEDNKYAGVHWSDHKTTGFYIHPFKPSKSSKAIFIHADSIIVNGRFSFISPQRDMDSSTSKKDYINLAKDFIIAVNENYEKLVLSRIKKIENNEKNLFDLFIKLKTRYPEAFVYIFNHPNYGCWMGASPEIFYSEANNKSMTVALAGTKLTEHKHKSWTNKNIHEQKLVANYVLNALKAEGISSNCYGPFDHIAGNVMHLKSEFQFSPPDDPSSLLNRLHPTPAVCGIPKFEAMDFILNHEKHERRYYTGYLGPVNFEKSTKLFVNLRCMQCSAKEIVLYLGGGIVAGSDPESEWNETENKAETLLSVLH